MNEPRDIVKYLMYNNVKTLHEFLQICNDDELCKYYYHPEGPKRFAQAMSIKDKMVKKSQIDNTIMYLKYITRLGKVNEQIEEIFSNNGIDITEFARDLCSVLNKEHPKIRSLRLVGPPNTGKSMIVQAIGAFLDTSYLSNTGSQSEFYFNDCLERTLIILEEVFVIPATADDFKSILSGYTLGVNIKGSKRRHLLNNTPVLLTGQTNLFGKGFLSQVDEVALSNRCHTYQLKYPFNCHEKISNLDIVHTILRHIPLDLGSYQIYDARALDKAFHRGTSSLKRQHLSEEDHYE